MALFSSYLPVVSLFNLIRRVSEAKLTDPANVPANLVTMNSQVSVTNLDSSRIAAIKLADPGQQRVSILAPLATSLLGSREGEVISLRTPYGSARFRVERILYQPEAAGDFTR